MLFTEARFLVFFALVFGFHWALPGNRQRKIWLLLSSYVFYGAWDWRFLTLIWISTTVDFIAGGMIGRSKSPVSRKCWLVGSLVCNLGLLGVFKYFHFFVDTGVAFLTFLGIPASVPTLQLILPVGISFYTFQTLSYTIDIYRRKLEPTDNPLDFALFVGFFPQLVAGPIVRASEFLPQLTRKHRLRDVAFRAHLTLFLMGYIKKACIADNIAVFIDPIFADPAAFDPLANWLALLLYSVQIYGDFSGYSDMAIAVGGLLGYKLPLNFNFPLLSTSFTEFWRRWHITLSTWFRDYLFIPLGGNRLGAWRTYVNLVTVFVLCGLWHGGSWKYVIFGLSHGLFLVGERITGLGRESAMGRPLRHVYFVFMIILTWPIFRTKSLGRASEMYGALFGFGMDPSPLGTTVLVWWAVLVGFYLVQIAMYRGAFRRPLYESRDWVFSMMYGVAAALALLFSSAGYQPFIYFQF